MDISIVKNMLMAEWNEYPNKKVISSVIKDIDKIKEWKDLDIFISNYYGNNEHGRVLINILQKL